MIVISEIFRVKVDKIEEAKVAFVLAQDASSAEDGCISYRFFQDLEMLTDFRLFEEWESQDALATHAKSSHIADFRAAQADFVVGKDLNRYEIESYGTL